VCRCSINWSAFVLSLYFFIEFRQVFRIDGLFVRCYDKQKGHAPLGQFSVDGIEVCRDLIKLDFFIPCQPHVVPERPIIIADVIIIKPPLLSDGNIGVGRDVLDA